MLSNLQPLINSLNAYNEDYYLVFDFWFLIGLKSKGSVKLGIAAGIQIAAEEQ